MTEKKLPPALIRQNHLGGLPQAGSGWHPKEDHLWAIPRYEIHPLTLREEAVDGLFFRMWPEHVEVLRDMRKRKWPPSEIIRVAKEFRKRQDAQDARDMELIEQHNAAQHAQDVSGATSLYGVEKSLTTLKAFSLIKDSEYTRALTQYRQMSSQQAKRTGRIVQSPSYAPLRKSNNENLSLSELSYSLDALEPHISKETMKHHISLHEMYLSKLKEALKASKVVSTNIEELLTRVFFMIGRNEHAPALRDNAGGFVNHNLYFEQLNPSPQKASEIFLSRLKQDLKLPLAGLKELLKMKAKRLVGSGWCWLVFNLEQGLLCYTTSNQDNPLMWGDIPLLAIDLWEHAYLRDADSLDSYMSDFFAVLDWGVVSDRYQNCVSSIEELSSQEEIVKMSRRGELGMFGIRIASTGEVIKADGEIAMSPVQRKVAKEQSFTHKEMGVGNAAYTAPQDRPSKHSVTQVENPANPVKPV